VAGAALVTPGVKGRARSAADSIVMRMHLAAATFALAAVLAATAGADAASRYAGTYTTMRPGANSTQAITLVLLPNGRAELITSYPDLVRSAGPGVLPISEVGTWRDRGATAEVRLTAFGLVRDGRIIQPKHDNNIMSFALVHCRLTAVRYSKINYGEAGLSFDKTGCR
jgi:hypothetical protein